MRDPCSDCEKIEKRNSFFREYQNQLLDNGETSESVSTHNHLKDGSTLSEGRLQLLANATFEGICVHNQGIILDANRQFCEMFGYPLEELQGIECFNLIAPQSQDMVREHISNGCQGPYESISQRKDGSTFPTEVRVREFQTDGKILRFAVFRDLTDYKKMEQQIAESEKRYRELYEHSPVALYRTRISDGKLLECNQALVDLLGYDSKEELLAINSVLAQYVNQQDRIILLKKLENKKRLEGFQIQLKRKDGEVLWVEDTVEIFPELDRLEGAMQDITVTKVLTKTEKMVYRLIVEGKSNKEIARSLERSARTIEDHRSHIMQKLKVDNLPDLVRKAQSLGS